MDRENTLMSRKRTWMSVALGAGVLLFAGGCVLLTATSRGNEGYTVITVEQLAAMLEDKDFVMVNVHVPYEGEIPQTDLFLPFNEIADYTGELPGKDETIVLYCRTDPMSTTAARTLVSLGYTDVLELRGGMRAWSAAGYELLED